MTPASKLRTSARHRTKVECLKANKEAMDARREHWELFNNRLEVKHQAEREGLALPWSLAIDFRNGLDTWLVFDTIEQYREYDKACKNGWTYTGSDYVVQDSINNTPRLRDFPHLNKPAKKQGFIERILGT